MRRHRLAISVVAVAFLATACGGGGTSTTTAVHPTAGGTLTIDNESGGLWSCGFNPFNAAVNFLAFGSVYEPLVYDNILNDKKTPLLATAYAWSPDNKSLTFTIRPGVTWSDGQPFSSADVVYTFNLMKSNSALDLQSVWSVLASVEQQGSDKVVMTFTQPSVPSFFFIADQVAIVPQHVWSKISDPVNENDPNPVGTGPFTVGQCTPQNITYTKNPNYWQKGRPYLDKVNYPAFTSNDPANAYLATGQAQWGGQFIPNIDSYYVAKDRAHNHYWFPPIQNVNLWINLTVSPLSNKAVRQALAFGIDRGKVSQIGEYGYEPPGNQTGVITPTFKDWVDAAQAAKYGYSYNPTKAIQLLQGAGFTRNSSTDTFHDSSGKPLSFTVINIGGYTDWVASLQVVQSELKQIGIDMKVQNLSQNDYSTQLYNGQFQLAYGSLSTLPGPTPFYELRNTLASAATAPIGQTAAGNYGRFNSSQADDLINAFTTTTDSAQQHKIMGQLEQIMLEDVPVIPITESVAWYEWTTKGFAGWPTQSDPYAAPAPWNLPDWEIVLTRVYKTS